MSSKNEGGPAFPQKPFRSPNGEIVLPSAWGLAGMTLRDWFAGEAMQAMRFGYMLREIHSEEAASPDCMDRAWIASDAYAMADAMLEVRDVAVPVGRQVISEAAIKWLHDNHPNVYAGFYELV